MLYLFFKLLRKINAITHSIAWRFKKAGYYYISKHRFSIHSSVIAGQHFRINTSDLSPATITINEGCRIRDHFNITIGNSGKLVIGSNCFFNNNCSLNCLGNIEIGDNNQFGEVVLFYDHNHQYTAKTQLVSEQGYKVGKITIGNNCWIGSAVTILKDVEIGDNVVIGAGCTIYKSVPSNTIVINHQHLQINDIDHHK